MSSEEKQTESASFFRELGGFMKPYSGKYAASVVVSILGVAANLAAYGFVGIIAGKIFTVSMKVNFHTEFVGQMYVQARPLDPCITNCHWETVFVPAAAAVICKVLHALLLNVSTWISHRAAYLTLRDIRNAVAAKLMRLPMGYFEVNGSGRLKTMLVDNVEGMEKTLAHMLPEMTANLLGPLALIVWMFLIDWRLALCALLWVVLGFLVTFGMMKGYEEKYAGQIAAMKGMNQAIVEYVGGIEVIKNFGRADECYQKYGDAVYGHAAYNVNWQKETQIFSSLGMAIAPFSLFPVLIAGLIFYGKHTLEAGTLFLMVLLTFGIFGPLMNAMAYFDQLAAMGTNAKEIRDVLDAPELKRGSETRPAGSDPGIAFSNVTFSYAAGSGPALRGISLRVPAGTMLALVGPSGSGKSTIAKLLAGYWDADSGEIFIGGKPIAAYSQEELNRQIAYVDQETFLFDESIMENIRIGCPTATDDEVMEAAKRTGCDEFIRALPQGYYTSAGAAGGKLSGGERQRIAIARAMMKNAPVMILDEATASSDPENEAAIQAALSEAAKGKTLIVVAHRLSTVMHAEQIAFVKDGSVKNIGTHSELLKNCPEYAAMWALAEGGQGYA